MVRETALGCKGRKRGGQHSDKDAAPTGILIIKQSLIYKILKNIELEIDLYNFALDN